MADEKKITKERVNQILNAQERVPTNLEEIDRHTQEGRMFADGQTKQAARDEVDEINAILQEALYETDVTSEADREGKMKQKVQKGAETDVKKLELTDEMIAILHQKKSADLAHLVLNENSKKDSSEMKEVKFYMEALVNTMETVRDKAAAPEVFNQLEEAYRMAIVSCNTYVFSEKKKDKNRMKLIREAWLDLLYEADMLCLHREDLLSGKLQGKTMGEIMHYAPKNAEQEVKRPKKKAKAKTKEKEQPKANPDLVLIKSYFTEKFSFSKSISGKTGAGSKGKQAEYVKELRDVLRKMTPGRMYVENLELFGKKVRLMQDADNKLYLLDGREKMALDLNAQVVALKIESDIMANSTVYGSSITKDLVADYQYDLKKQRGNRVTGSKAQIRQQLINFLCANLSIEPHEFAGVSRDKILDFANELVAAQGDKTVDMETVKNNLRAQITAAAKLQSELYVNGVELTELMERDAERNVEEINAKFSYNIQKKNVLEADPWTAEETAVKDLLADLIFAQDTMLMDKSVYKPEEYIKDTLMNHKDALLILMKEKQLNTGAKDSVDMLDNIMEKLNMNLLLTGKTNLPEVVCKQLKALRDLVFSKLKDPKDLLDEEKASSRVEELLQNSSVTMKDDFISIKAGMDEAVRESSDMLQENINAMVDMILPETSEEAQKEAEKTQSLRKIIENASKSTKGQGKFTRTVLKEYFGKMSALDQRSMLSSLIRSGKKVNPEEERKVRETDKALIERLKKNKDKEEDYKNLFEGKTGKELTKEQKAYLDDYRQKLENMAWEAEMLGSTEAKFRDAFSGEKFSTDGKISDEQKALIEEYKKEKRKMTVAANHFGGLIKGAGPLFLKMMQGLPQDALPDAVNEALKDVKSNLPPIPERIVRSQLLEMIERSGNTVTKMEVVKSLGAATVAETLLVKAYGPDLPAEGKELVVKILRPDAKNRLAREEKIMLECAKKVDDGGMLATYKGQLENYKKEFDLSIEAQNVKKGEIYNNMFQDVESMKLNSIINPTSSSMVEEKAPGVTLDNYVEELNRFAQESRDKFFEKNEKGEILVNHLDGYDPKDTSLMIEVRDQLAKKINEAVKRRDHIANLCNAWLTQGMLKGGFYHADLHAGNILVDDEKATMIDYGNAMVLTKTQQESLARMVVAIGYGEEDLFFGSFENILKEMAKDDPEFAAFYTPEVAQKLKTLAGEVLKMGDDEEADLRLQVFLIKAQELGVKIPPEVYNFSQGELRLQNSINDLNDSINEMKQLMKTIEKKCNVKSPRVDALACAQFKVANDMDEDEMTDDHMEKGIKSYAAELGPLDVEEFKKAVLDKTHIQENKAEGIKGVDKREDFVQTYLGGGLDGIKAALEEAEVTMPSGEKLPALEAIKHFKANLDDYFKKHENDEPGEHLRSEARTAKNSMMIQEFANDDLGGAFGGMMYLDFGLEEALTNLDKKAAEEIVSIYTDIIPKLITINEKIEELHKGQDAMFFFRMGQDEQEELAEEIAELYKDVHAAKVAHHSQFTHVTQVLKDREVDPCRELDGNISSMFTVQTDGIGEAFREKYTQYRTLEKNICEEGRNVYGNMAYLFKATTTKEQKVELANLQREVLELYKKASYYQIKEYSDKMYQEKVTVKSYGFEKVMKDTVMQNWGEFALKIGTVNTAKIIAEGLLG